jgi:hypothetical protein
MKLLFKVTLLVILFILPACHRNRLKTNEKTLINKLKMDERAQETADSLARRERISNRKGGLPGGLFYKEDRSVNPLSPPVKIDIAGNLNNIKEYKLSDVASEINYVRLETVPDSTFPREMKFKYYLTSDYIVATNPGGILLYSKDGKFVNTIVKNKTTGITVTADMMTVLGVNTFIGGATSVWSEGNKILYNYRNSIYSQDYIMEYDLSKIQLGPSKQFDPENPEQIIGLGEIAIDMNPTKKNPEWKYKISPELVSWSMPTRYVYQSIGTIFLNKNTYAKALERTDDIALLNNDGDTISTLTNFDEGNTISFENEGKQYLWDNLNDTVFHIAGTNRIIPVSILNLGKYKATLEQVRQIGSDLTGTIIPIGYAENRNFIFLLICRDAFDSQNNRKHKKVKIYHLIFSKQNHQLSIIKGDPYNYTPEILENNIDGGMPVWPASYMVSKNGEIMISLKGKDLKERVKSEQFKSSSAPELKKNLLKEFAFAVSNNEDILMIIK